MAATMYESGAGQNSNNGQGANVQATVSQAARSNRTGVIEMAENTTIGMGQAYEHDDAADVKDASQFNGNACPTVWTASVRPVCPYCRDAQATASRQVLTPSINAQSLTETRHGHNWSQWLCLECGRTYVAHHIDDGTAWESWRGFQGDGQHARVTANGWAIRAVYQDTGAFGPEVWVVAEQGNTGRYCVGKNYNSDSGQWVGGMYDYPTFKAALEDLKNGMYQPIVWRAASLEASD